MTTISGEGLSQLPPTEVKKAAFDPQKFELITSGLPDKEIWTDDDSVATLESALYQDPRRNTYGSGGKVFQTACRMINYAVRSRFSRSAEDNDPVISQKALDLIQRNVPILEEKIVKRKKGDNDSLELIEDLIFFGNPDQRAFGYSSLGRHSGVLSRALKDPYARAMRNALVLIVSGEDQQISQDVRKMIVESLQKVGESAELDHAKAYVLGEWAKKKTMDGYWPAELTLSLSLFMKAFGLDFKTYLKAWRQSKRGNEEDESGWTSTIRSNLDVISDIERAEKGACAFLTREFGIYDFGRYFPEMLIDQYKESNNTEIPYGVILYPRYDWNDAFNSPHTPYKLYDLYRQIKRRKYLVRVVEAGDKIEIARMLGRLDTKYGGNHKISFAVVGGHGTVDSIRFGSGARDKNILTAEDFLDHRFPKTRSFFEDHPTIILESCSTGAERGIGQQLSEKLGAIVIAPDTSSATKKIKVKQGKGRLTFEVSYYTAEGKEYSKGENLSDRTT